jgi:glycosyltransferase involved in cell wall biosynthesis
LREKFDMTQKIICIHIGARAHYLLPAALESQNNLEALITDTWISSAFARSLLSKAPPRIVKSLSKRYLKSLPAERVYSFTLKFLLLEFYLRFRYKDRWKLILRRNFFFEKYATAIFKKLSSECAVLGISYTSLSAFRIAKARGQKTILFQIDPGVKEEQIVINLVSQHQSSFQTTWKRAPDRFWADWRNECDVSDVIMVNSEWTKAALIEEGIEEAKLKILPLPFQIEPKHLSFKREHPNCFQMDRPLRLLFLGTLTLRKGIHLVLEAAARLIDHPIEFILVGHNELENAALAKPNVTYKGVISRSEVDRFYKHADAFLFPTLSDGFGLTQLEALSWNLPVIASKSCGNVVIDGYNGILLPTCDVDELVSAILKCLNEPAFLQWLSSHGIETVRKFGFEQFAEEITKLAE